VVKGTKALPCSIVKGTNALAYYVVNCTNALAYSFVAYLTRKTSFSSLKVERGQKRREDFRFLLRLPPRRPPAEGHLLRRRTRRIPGRRHLRGYCSVPPCSSAPVLQACPCYPCSLQAFSLSSCSKTRCRLYKSFFFVVNVDDNKLDCLSPKSLFNLVSYFRCSNA
jgi:hypothetical protein